MHRRPGNLRWILLALAVLAGLAGYYGPWVPHRAAGLVILGLDLAEYVKFLPQVRSGAIQLQRELFYLPLFVAAVIGALLSSRRRLPAVARVFLGLAAIPLALAMLPPAWRPETLFQPEFRLQTAAIAFCLALAPGAILTRFLPDRLVLILAALMCIAAAVIPAWAFLQVLPAIAELYNHPLAPGWGFWLCLAGYLTAAVIALGEAMDREA